MELKQSGDRPEKTSRRDLLNTGLRLLAAAGLVGLPLALSRRSAARRPVWQIDPDKCVQCERCATYCVQSQSAVKCVHDFSLCGYCALCGGYTPAGVQKPDTAAENQICPAGAIKRRFVEEPFYEYTIDPELCIGCARCAKGCGAFGNGSLYLQIQQDRCLHCQECAIAVSCPSGAIRQLPDGEAYLLRSAGRKG